jgi:hypothetical protein
MATETRTDAVPSALPPTEAELAAWNALTRDEQIARYRAVLTSPPCQTVTTASMDDIRDAARQRLVVRG